MAAARRHPQTTCAEGGSILLQFLIVAVVLVVFVAIAVPVYSARAQQTVLQQNAASLALEVRSYLAQDLATAYVPVDDVAFGVPANTRNASEVFARALGGPQRRRSSYYVDPYDASHAVVCTSELPLPGPDTPPAVWITDDPRFSWEAFTPTALTRERLRGTLMVVFLSYGERTSGIEVFYVDGSGARSPSSDVLAL